jgi:hypothetical protein
MVKQRLVSSDSSIELLNLCDALLKTFLPLGQLFGRRSRLVFAGGTLGGDRAEMSAIVILADQYNGGSWESPYGCGERGCQGGW